VIFWAVQNLEPWRAPSAPTGKRAIVYNYDDARLPWQQLSRFRIILSWRGFDGPASVCHRPIISTHLLTNFLIFWFIKFIV